VSSADTPAQPVTSPPVRTSDRLIAVVESFLSRPTQTLSQVAAACGMELPTTTRYLQRLVEHQWLERDEVSRGYRLGVRLIELGEAARAEHPLVKRILPYMRDLLSQFDETVNLAVHRGEAVIIIEGLEGRWSVRRGASIGDRDNWTASSLGKAILAHLPGAAVDKLLADYPPVRLTDHSLTDIGEVKAQLAQIRQRGYAIDDEEGEVGLKCVGVPILDDHGHYTHALSVSGPVARMDQQLEDIISALTSTAARLAAAVRPRGGHDRGARP
jgi:DNA-binding IclR family transcriptional regulator